MTTPNALTALAEACERAADALERAQAKARAVFACPMYNSFGGDMVARRQAEHAYNVRAFDANTLRFHAAALRAGRVTVNEGGVNGTV